MWCNKIGDCISLLIRFLPPFFLCCAKYYFWISISMFQGCSFGWKASRKKTSLITFFITLIILPTWDPCLKWKIKSIYFRSALFLAWWLGEYMSTSKQQVNKLEIDESQANCYFSIKERAKNIFIPLTLLWISMKIISQSS